MYVEFFGLKHPPFRARANGGDVFVGPQQARLMSGLKKALTERDAVVSISGPVGIGKTISATRAMDAVTSSRTTARIGRMQLGREEILELLLIEFDLADKAQTTPQRFGAFRGLLNDKEDAGERVFIVVEDACRVGVEGLQELESLTSADSGDSSGANIILLGPPDFESFIKTPQLARLRQRIRLRHTFSPYTPAEVRGYVAHRVREAGGDLDALFDADAINALHRYAEGIPRMINTLANAVLAAAADEKASKITADLLTRIAREDFGVDTSVEAAASDASAPAGTTPTARGSAETPDNAKDTALEVPDDIDIPELIQDTMPDLKVLPDPAAGKSPQEVIAALRDKTNSTEPSLPVLDMSVNRPADNELTGRDVDSLSAEERRVMLEPRVPEPLSKNVADTQTIKALDSALRPDTQLLEALDMVAPVLPENQPVPLGLQEPAPQQPAGAGGTEKLPTLSDSMRLDAPPTPAAEGAAKTPDINALEAALAVARKGPIDLSPAQPAQNAATGSSNAVETPAQAARPAQAVPTPAAIPATPPAAPVAAKPAAPAPNTVTQPTSATPKPSTPATPAAPLAATPAVPETPARPVVATPAAPKMPAAPATAPTTAPTAPAAPTAAANPPAATPPAAASPVAPTAKDAVPEITLEDDMRRQQEAARARLAEEAAKVAAAMAAKEKQPSEAEKAAAAELAAEKERLAGMKSIGAQFSAGSELSLEDTQSALQRNKPAAGKDTPAAATPSAAEPPPAAEPPDEDPAEQARLQKLAAELGNATSLEDIDDLAAETLFGEEFSQIAATVAALAANDTEAAEALELEPPAAGQAAAGGSGPAVSPAASGPTGTPAAPAGSKPGAPAAPGQAPARGGATPAPAQKTAAAPNMPPAATRPPGQRPATPPKDIDSSAARRLEMVRSLNKGAKPPGGSMVTEDIVLGEVDSSPTHTGPAPEPIENQFGTSMTANLKALSAQSIEAMQKAEKQEEEKKPGLLSRFKRS